MVTIQKELVIKLPVSGEELKLERITWGERLEVEDICYDQRTGRSDLRRLHQLLTERSTKGMMGADRYYSLDINDGFAVRDAVQKLNGLDSSFLPQSEAAEKVGSTE